MMRNAVEVGQLFKQHRLHVGIGVRELGRMVGMEPSTICKLESGYRGGSVGRTALIAAAHAIHMTRVEIDTILCLGGYLPPDVEEKIIDNPHVLEAIRKMKP